MKTKLYLFLVGLVSPWFVFAETQNTISMTTSQIFPGDSTSFSSTQTSGAAANAAGTMAFTYSGIMRFSLSTATGRYAGSAGATFPGINLGPFLFMRSFLSSSYYSAVTSSPICPGTTSYNWLGIRFRPPFPTNRAGASDASGIYFNAGGNLTYDTGAPHVITGNEVFDLSGPTLKPSPNYYFDPVALSSCASGSVRMLAGGTISPMDDRGNFLFGDSGFFYLSGNGNPMMAIGLTEQTLSGAYMLALANSGFSGLYTQFGTVSPVSGNQVQRNIILFPDSLGTTFSLFSLNDLDDPSNRTALGTIACTNLNTPRDGFCSGTLSLSGVSGTGKATCIVSRATPEWTIACTAQHPSDTRVPISLVTRVPSKALLSVTLDQPYYSVASAGNSIVATATVRNLSGKAVTTMGNPSNAALRLSAPFSNAGAYSGGGGACGSSLAGYGSCTVSITYAPSSLGTSLQTFRVAYDDGYYGTVNATARIVGIAGLSSIAVSPATASFSLGSTVQYTATATYSDASTQDVTSVTTWASTNSSVVSMATTGVASFVQSGSANVMATLGAVSDSKSVSSSGGGTLEVLGQPDPDGTLGAVTGLSAPTSMIIVSGRLFLADTSNHRVLIWDTVPTSSDTPADLVLGQPDLDTRTANSGGISAQSLSSPTGLASDGTRLVVTDSGNNRVLIWNTLPTTTQQAADLVLGQSGFTSNNADQGGISLATVDYPSGVAIMGSGASARLVVADRDNHRALVWHTFPTSNKQAATLRLGQSTNNGQTANAGGSVAANTLNTPYGVATDGTKVYIADYNNHRVVVWNSLITDPLDPSFVQQPNASFALGQPNLTSDTANNGGQSAATLRSPYGVHTSGTYVYVADNQNHRVLIWTSLPSSSGTAANLVLGQSSYTTRTANNGGVSATSLSAPTGVFVSSSKLYVTDNQNHRVLIWNSIPTVIRQAADSVLGQANLTKNEVNSVGIPDATTLRLPSSVTSCNSKLIIADANNNRVLIWNSIPTTNGQAADLVLGQADFASNTANSPSRSATTFNNPIGVYCDGTRLFVADTGNHRVLMWNTVPTTNQKAADYVLGQSGFTTATANQGGLGASTLNGPRSVYSNGTRVFVADSGNHRILIWNSIPTANKQAADVVLGQPNLTSNTANNGGRSEFTLNAPYSVHSDGTYLFVADYNNHRVLMWTTLPIANQTAANYVLGQSDFTTATANQGGIGSSTLRNPSGVYGDGTSLFIADYTNHRIIIHDTYPTTNKQAASRQVGQPNFTGATLNNGGLSATSLYNPMGVYADGERLFIADYNNYRMTVVGIRAKLIFTEAPTYNYGDVVMGNTSIRTFTVKNLGSQSATSLGVGTPALSLPFSYVGGTYPGTSGTCGNSLAGSATCTVRVQFNPTLEASSFSDVIRLSYQNGVTTQSAVVGVVGRSVLQSALTFMAGASYNFGNVTVGTSADVELTVSNASGVTSSLLRQGNPALSAPFSVKGGQYPGTGGTCGTVLTTGNTCKLVVRFSPTSLGLSSQTFRLSYYNGATTTTVNITISGTGN